MSDQIPWDAPSRFGRAGLLARRALRRALRPVTLREAAERDRLIAELASARGEIEDGRAAVRRLERRLTGVADAAERAGVFGLAADAALGDLLLRDLPPDSRVVRQPAGPARRAICSLGTGPYRSLLSRSAVSFERYAERWGWDVVLSTEDLAQGRPAPWGKVPLLQSLLEDYDWVLWLDADVVIADLEADIAAEARDGKDLHLVEHSWFGDNHTANFGVLLLRSTDWSREFLTQVWNAEEFTDHPFWENAAVLKLLGYEPDPWHVVTPTPALARTAFLPLRFNSVEPDRADPPAFVHRGFYDAATRTRQVTADLQCVLGGAHPMTAGWTRPARRIAAVADVHRREELPLLLNAKGLRGTGVEVGVRRGDFSAWLLEHWAGERLLMIDPWQADAPGAYHDISNVSQDAHESNLAATRRRVERFGERAQVWRATGVEAAASVPAGTLDFVYLDARHDERAVREDLETWWPLVRPGGVIAGHDYLDGDLPEGDFGVRRAVDAFFAGAGLDVHATTDDEPWSSWIVERPLAGTGTTPMEHALALLDAQDAFAVLQIGAHTGDTPHDPLFAFLRRALPSRPEAVAVLVEPVASAFAQLERAYAGLENVRLENVAVADEEGERPFHRLGADPAAHGQPEWLAQLGSLRDTRMTDLWERYEGEELGTGGRAAELQAFWLRNSVTDSVRCTTVAALLERHGIRQLDLLQIDAEGYDYEILRTIDFDTMRPRFINYERVLLGEDGPACRALLTAAGYRLIDWGQDTLAIAQGESRDAMGRLG